MNSRPPGSRLNLVGSIIIVLFGLLFCWSAVNDYLHPFAELEGASLKPITGRLSEDPYIHRTRSTQVRLSLQEYPDVRFLIYEFYSAADIRGISTLLKVGDTVTMDIIEEDADKYLHHTRPLSFWEKHFNSAQLTIYSLSDAKDNWYLDVRPSDPASVKGNSAAFILFFTIGAVLIILGSVNVRKYARLKE
ncbi:MAG: hypothetical protein JNM41_10625 [Flavipsychrobacter sp.]|nr:hypothetical protein [Flavipsychrobacter sp.]